MTHLSNTLRKRNKLYGWKQTKMAGFTGKPLSKLQWRLERYTQSGIAGLPMPMWLRNKRDTIYRNNTEYGAPRRAQQLSGTLKWLIIICLLIGGFAIAAYVRGTTIESGALLNTKVGAGLLSAAVAGYPESPTLRNVQPLTIHYDIETSYANQKVYGYSSTVDQTDSDPFTTASGQRVEYGIIANNCHDFGTKVIIYDPVRQYFFGVYEVQDRMNGRYGCNDWDIWFSTRQEALNWGVQNLIIYVIK